MDNFFEEEQSGDNGENYEQVFHQQHEIEHAQLHLAHKELDLRLLSEAVKIAEKSFFWRFYSLEKKMKTIILTYNILVQILDPEIQEEEEQ